MLLVGSYEIFIFFSVKNTCNNCNNSITIVLKNGIYFELFLFLESPSPIGVIDEVMPKSYSTEFRFKSLAISDGFFHFNSGPSSLLHSFFAMRVNENFQFSPFFISPIRVKARLWPYDKAFRDRYRFRPATREF